MDKRSFLVSILLLWCSSPVCAQPLFTSVSKAGEATLLLNGVGVREVSAFGVDVYRAALYLEEMSSDENAILTSDSPKKLSMVYLREIDAEDIREAWDESFTDNCKPPLKRCGQMGLMRKRFLALLGDVLPQERWDFEFSRDGVRIFKKGTEIAMLEDEDFSRLLLATWIGAKPPTSELKRSLLGRK